MSEQAGRGITPRHFVAFASVLVVVAGIIVGAMTVRASGTGAGGAEIAVTCGTAFNWDARDAERQAAIDNLSDAYAGKASASRNYTGQCPAARQSRQMVTWALIVIGVLGLGGALLVNNPRLTSRLRPTVPNDDE